MTDFDRIKKLVSLQELFLRKSEIEALYKEQENKLDKLIRERDSNSQSFRDIEINIREMDRKISEELGKRDEITTRMNNLEEGKDRIKIARQLKSWEKEKEKLQQELSLIQAQIDYDTTKQIEMKNELERIQSKIGEVEGKISELQVEVSRIKEQYQTELDEIEGKQQVIIHEFDIQFIDYFNSLLVKTNGTAIVVIEEGAKSREENRPKETYCSGCNIVLPTQLQGDLGPDLELDQIDLHYCPHCFRYLYYYEWLDREE